MDISRKPKEEYIYIYIYIATEEHCVFVVGLLLVFFISVAGMKVACLLTYLLACLLTYLLTYLLTCLLAYLLTYSLPLTL